ncbi:peptidoglycan bridge formation glycyltransferase FemA/FemB family protein [Deinococcus detaillensis]|uniref:Peptidoglycan bridge formation glycyltransferase FemA/FemB family protein n=1 Tax=Deinococcus detaillensis TaxID=2592048 RepID=A0A553V134_9DEIO|nr:peptidoglycan bridge formation glycyltransferase FemA/FemB family protein [Deinococcus detaillensis]TSA86153.1 peptidoglycan bridge formation glycyltransferase FemA/FemB family protein [Deinococcus detaillensis]
MPLELLPTQDARAYDEVVARLPVTSALQGWGYGEARRELGQVPTRYFIRDQGQIVGALQLIRKRLVPGFDLLYAPRGPVLSSMAQLPDLAPALRKLARPTDTLIKIEPPFARTPELIPEQIGPWRRTEAEQPEHTITVNLMRPPAELLKNLHSMARRNVKTAQKFGVEVVSGGEELFEEFWTIFTATNERAQLGAFPKSYYLTMLRSGASGGGDAYIVLARHEGRALAGGFFLAMGAATNYLFGGSIKDDRPAEGSGAEGAERKDAKAPTAFYWGAMQDAQQRGYRSFDFWGIPRKLDEGKHSFGVYRMKENFGGEKVWFPGYELPLSPLAPLIVRGLRWRKTQNNLRKRGSAEDVL